MRRIFAFLAALMLAMPFCCGQARAQEHILSFRSKIDVDRDGSLDVVETIRVNVLGEIIKRGITRDFPTRYKDRSGQTVVVGFSVEEVLRDGRSEPYTLEGLSNGIRIRIGDKNIFLPKGPTTYAIHYRATRELGFYKDYDEVYWNVTGNGWTFPIDQAETAITLPLGAEILQSSIYTGYAGQTAHDAVIDTGQGGVFRAHTTTTLQPSQGFTVAVSWPKGFVNAPTMGQKVLWFIQDNLPAMISLLGVIVVCGFYLYAWWKVGRDPTPGVIVPAWHPPEGLTAAAARYIRKRGFDDKTFSSALIALAVKGYVKIADTESSYRILPQQKLLSGLGAEESRLVQAIGSDALTVATSSYQRVAAARSAVSGTLEEVYKGEAFRLNRGWFLGGLGLSIAFLIAGFLAGPDEGAPLVAGGFFAVWWIVIVIAGRTMIARASASRGLARLGRMFGLLMLLPFVLIGLAMPAVFTFAGNITLGNLVPTLAAAAMVGLNLVFFFLLAAPTRQGRVLLDKIEGFRMYLATVEEDRLNILNPPEKTPDLFERYLPYALALDCSNQWSSKFTAILAAAGVGAPAWYIGNNWNSSTHANFASNLGSSLASSAASASSPPGSSSSSGGGFSGGGGSSGGGGGGGGGSGW